MAFLFLAMDKEFLKKTVEFWQPYYQQKLTEEDARVIVTNISLFFDLLNEGDAEERMKNTVTDNH